MDQVLAVAEHLDTVNLPAERGHIESILDRSEKAFAAQVPVGEREFLFVLEDLQKKKIIGTSMIYAQHGTKRAPHIFFRVENDERYSVTLDKHFIHQTLRIGYNYNGPTEIGGLILLPEYRRNTEGLGKALSYVRFLFIRMHRPLFRSQVLSELLPDEVQRIIGKVGPETQAVEGMLRRIGFDYAGQIDPFDGGPHFVADTDDITLVKAGQEVEVRTVEGADGERPWAVLAVQGGSSRPMFRAIGTRVIPLGGGVVGITEDARQRLAVEDGKRVWLCYG